VSDFGELTRRELPELGSNRRPWFVLELLEGETLAAKLDREGPLDPREAARIFEQVARGLGAAHRAGAVHRDLKPDNVFLCTKDGRSIVKVLDFGVARLLSASRLTRQGVVFGSPHYMSPEQAAGQEIDGRSDVYSVGVALYETLSGRLPFEADSTSGVLTKHVFVEPDPIEAVVRDPARLGELGTVVMRCLAKRPSSRYESAEELAEALAQAARGARASRCAPAASGAVDPASPGPRPGAGEAPPAPRARAVIVMPAVALAAIACALGALVWLRGPTARELGASSGASVEVTRTSRELDDSALDARPAPARDSVAPAVDAPSTVTIATPPRPPRPTGSITSPSPATGPSAVAAAPPTASQPTAAAPPAARTGAASEPTAPPATPSARPAASSELIEIF
jgi:serine/threonine-protein kinase